MNTLIKALYDLQQVDTRISRLRKEHAALDTGAGSKKEMEAAQADLHQAQENLKRKTADLRDHELELQSIESKKKEIGQKLYSGRIRNPKELTTMEQEVEVLKHRQIRLEEDILVLMEAVEIAKASMTDKEKVAAEKEKVYREKVAHYQSETQRMRGVLQQLNTERARIVASLDPAALYRYEDLRKRIGELAVVLVEDKTCGGCRMTLSASVLRRLQQEESFQTCENCGRLLYFEEGVSI